MDHEVMMMLVMMTLMMMTGSSGAGGDINIHTDARCGDAATLVPHRGGVWMFAVSRTGSKNTGCMTEHDPEEKGLAGGPWRSTGGYTIAGGQHWA
jgi:hypothetical protein